MSKLLTLNTSLNTTENKIYHLALQCHCCDRKLVVFASIFLRYAVLFTTNAVNFNLVHGEVYFIMR